MVTLETLVETIPTDRWAKRKLSVQINVSNGHVVVLNFKYHDKEKIWTAREVSKCFDYLLPSRWNVIGRALSCQNIAKAINVGVKAKLELLDAQLLAIVKIGRAMEIEDVNSVYAAAEGLRQLLLLEEEEAESYGWGQWMLMLVEYLNSLESR